MAASLLVLHGPNLNLLGSREPGIYGASTLADINGLLEGQARLSNAALQCFQTNAESDLIARIHAAATDGTTFIVINPAAWTHTSVAIRDALSAVQIPFIEVHLSNVFKRESFRHRSLVSDLAVGVISGLGVAGYQAAVAFGLQHAVSAPLKIG